VLSLFSFPGRRIAMNRYLYDGPVMEFDRCVQSNWKGETMAASETKARSNLSYQWKKRNNRIASVKITLPGKLREIS
jgi:hypothetical protein